MDRHRPETRLEQFDRQERRFVWIAVISVIALLILIGT
jgi:hypothetical protein